MKLKKIASLMLAGIMAVSMLAGCKTGDSSSSSSSEVVPTGLVGAVIENLDSKTTDKVAFTASSALQATLDKMVAYYGYDKNMTDIAAADVTKFDSDLKKSDIPQLDAKNKVVDSDDEVASVTKVVTYTSSDANTTYVAKGIAAAIENKSFGDGSRNIDKLELKSNDVKNADGDSCYYTFAYTGDIAVSAISDDLNNQTVYVALVTITRTPTEHAL